MDNERNALPTQTLLPAQIRFLWQCAPVTDGILTRWSEKFAIPFSYGYDGIVVKLSRHHAPGWWKWSSDGSLCVLYYGDLAGLSEGFSRLEEKITVENGRVCIPCGEEKQEAKKADE